jgi:hypothetical protein
MKGAHRIRMPGVGTHAENGHRYSVMALRGQMVDTG